MTKAIGAKIAWPDWADTDYRKAEFLQDCLVSFGYSGKWGEEWPDYGEIRAYFVSNPILSVHLPDFVKGNRGLAQIHHLFCGMADSFSDVDEYVWGEFSAMLDFLENQSLGSPADCVITNSLGQLDRDRVQEEWSKALSRRSSDPEGAITSAKTLLETVCKHILEEGGAKLEGMPDITRLYGMLNKRYNLAPDQHSETALKQILSGITSVVVGLGTLRNSLGDAHGKGVAKIRPSSRHAQLAVNLAGSLAVFLVETASLQGKTDNSENKSAN